MNEGERHRQVMAQLEEITAWQHSQDERLERLNRVVFGDEDYEGMKQKVEHCDVTLSNWSRSIKGVRKAFAAILFLISSGALAAIISFFQNFGSG